MAIEKEMLRVVGLFDLDGGKTQVTNNLPFRKAPEVCGHLLADIVRHFEQKLKEDGLEDDLESMMGHFFNEMERGPSPICRKINGRGDRTSRRVQ